MSGKKSNLREAAEMCAFWAAIGYFWGGYWVVGRIESRCRRFRCDPLVWEVLYWVGGALIVIGGILYFAYRADQEKKN